MEPKEPIEIRKEMAIMHDEVLARIQSAYKRGQFFEVCWLCYGCFENRINRSLEKICSGCSKPARTDNTRIGITTKIDCLLRLMKQKYSPLQDEDRDLISTIKGWCAERNNLTHGIISLDQYFRLDKEFENLAKRGVPLVKKLYSFGTDVREYYYGADQIPEFDSKTQKTCRLKVKCIRIVSSETETGE